MKLILYLSIFILASFGCSSLRNTNNRTNVNNLIITKYVHNRFNYLEIFDKRRSIYFNYPVGDEKLEFTGGIGPIYEITKRQKKSSNFSYLTTSSTQDSICFFDYCYKKKGILIEIEDEDKILFQQADSFCRANYSFYKRDIIMFKSWYIPNR